MGKVLWQMPLPKEGCQQSSIPHHLLHVTETLENGAYILSPYAFQLCDAYAEVMLCVFKAMQVLCYHSFLES